MKDILQYLLFVLIAVGFLYFVYSEYKPQILSWFVVEDMDVRIYVADKPFAVSIADNEAERRQGLSGVKELGRYEGKLFIFDESGHHGIWMKDMLFPIDILWFNESFDLIYTAEQIEPETYPEIFTPSTPAKYVLEIRSGSVDELNLSLGDPLDIPEVYIETFDLQ